MQSCTIEARLSAGPSRFVHPAFILSTYAENMAADSPTKREVVGCLILDIAATLVFTAVGRATHGEDALGLLDTAWPFLVGLAGGWLAARAWRQPRIIRFTSIIVWLSTVAIGMVIRALIGQSVESSFVFVSIVALGAFMLGWRGFVWIITVLLAKDPNEVPPATGRTTTPKNRPASDRRVVPKKK